MRNLILSTDSYKLSHFRQYPPEARAISAYVEARPNAFSKSALFFGLQAFLVEYLGPDRVLTGADIDMAEEVAHAHGLPFNRAGWEDIIRLGHLPLEIRALPEGTLTPTGVPMIEVVNTHPAFAWLTTYIETALLRAIWYPTTVATLSQKAKAIIRAGLEKSSDDPAGQIAFKLHDFGARGVSSGESAALGGLAHLVNFMGTDTLEAIVAARQYYGEPMAGFSIPASEHSTMTSWGRSREVEACANMLTAFPEGLVASVSDSYDLDNTVSNIWGGVLKPMVLQRNGTLVVRPDSGNPVSTPVRVLQRLWDTFGGTLNSKGYRVLDPHVRIIQGDGMNLDTIALLIDAVTGAGFAVDNIAMGMGGGLLQQVNRDTLRFAMKANAMQTDDGTWTDVSKTPATDLSKASKAGRQAAVLHNGVLVARRRDAIAPGEDQMRLVWRNGALLINDTLTAIRARADASLSQVT